MEIEAWGTMAHSGMATAIPEDGAVMKRLILFLLSISSLGAHSQGAFPMAQTETTILFPYGEHHPHFANELANHAKTGSETERLLVRADQAYSKLGFAKAARLYDRVLARPGTQRSEPLLAKAGDAHYFSGDLRSAHALYMEGDGRAVESDLDKIAGDGARRLRAAHLTAFFEGRGPMEPDSIFPGEGVPLIQIRNLKELNSRFSDFAPMFHRDTQLVFASSRDTGFLKNRRYKRNKQPFLDLYVTDLQGEGDSAMSARKFSQVLNTKYHEASVAFSKDQRTIYFTRNNFGKRLKRRKNKDVAHLKIFRSTLVAGQWTPAEELSINGESFSTGHPNLSPDGKRLYFVSDRPGGYGG